MRRSGDAFLTAMTAPGGQLLQDGWQTPFSHPAARAGSRPRREDRACPQHAVLHRLPASGLVMMRLQNAFANSSSRRSRADHGQPGVPAAPTPLSYWSWFFVRMSRLSVACQVGLGVPLVTAFS